MLNKYNLKDKSKLIYSLLFNKEYKNMIIEKCSLCDSLDIKVLEKEDNNINYKSKYVCNTCGATCDNQEKWKIKNKNRR